MGHARHSRKEGSHTEYQRTRVMNPLCKVHSVHVPEGIQTAMISSWSHWGEIYPWFSFG